MASPGLRWADLDAATQQHGLAVTGGQISHTGIAGLTLGGGMGWLARQVGLTIDHLVSADIVTADGALRRAAPDADVDLYWAIRGGGGNFGVATSFTYRLQPVGPEVSVYQLAFPVEVAAQVFPEAEKLLEASPPSLSATFAFLTTPEGMPVAALTLVSTASSELTAQSFAPFRGLGTPVFEETVRVPYTALQRMLDQVAAPGLRYYGRGNFLDTLDPLVIEPLATAYAEAPSPQSLVLFVRLGGAVAAIPMEATAFAHRNRPWAVTALAIWRDPTDDDANRTWIERAWSALPALPKAVYVNELGDEGNERVRAAYGPNYERLSQLKRRYDPNNLFRLNQNIRPA
jgi:FAD/FMN-containing dehydrogenase